MGRTKLDRKRYFPGDGRAMLVTCFLIFMYGVLIQGIVWLFRGPVEGLQNYALVKASFLLALAYGLVRGLMLLIKKHRKIDG